MNRIVSAGPGLVIGIPTLGRPVSLDWSNAYKSLSAPINFNCNIVTVLGKPVAEARNFLAEEAIKLKAKYLFFLGDDVLVPAHTLKQLIFRMEHNPKLGIVGGVYCSKCDPPAPLVFRGNGSGSYWDWKVGEYFEVTGLGMDCTLIRTDVFKELPGPWFKTLNEDKFLDAVNYADLWTEDLYFCKRVIEETSYEIFCDASIICQHFDIYSGKSWSLPANSAPTRRISINKPLQALDIGCGPCRRYDEFSGYDLLRVDIDEQWEPDYRCDVRSLPFDNNAFDLVFSSHVLEHFDRRECGDVLPEWLRVLKPGGKFQLVLPTLDWAAEQLLKPAYNYNDVWNVLYGAQSSPYDFHKNGFTTQSLGAILLSLDLKDISIERELNSYNMRIMAIKR
jgi:predicted SAM-dependent methyltransferase